MIDPVNLNSMQRAELSSILADVTQRAANIENALDSLERGEATQSERDRTLLREEVADQVDELLSECETLQHFAQRQS